MMLEFLGLAARVAFEVLFELIWCWDPSDRLKYRDYLKTVPAGQKPVSKRQWKASGKPERPESADSTS